VPEQPFLSVVGVSKSLTSADGRVLPVNRDVTLTVRPGEFVSSWLSMVFQEYNKTLFPWLSVRKNVRLAVRDIPKAAADARIDEALAQVGLADFASHYPWELSGGMQQRVALARAMASQPELLLMDEPFASVDALTRAKLEDMVLDLWQQAGFAAILVTHDIGEAVYLSDRVLALSGRPSTILSEVRVDLPRPRSQSVTRATPRFHELSSQLLALVEHAGQEGW
jgi:NitT/TauT family transport system ATP-binding protein